MKTIKQIIKVIIGLEILTGNGDLLGIMIPFALIVYLISVFTKGTSGHSKERNSWMESEGNNRFMNQMNEEHQRRFTEESLKSVTPWELGGYDMNQGNSWNQDTF